MTAGSPVADKTGDGANGAEEDTGVADTVDGADTMADDTGSRANRAEVDTAVAYKVDGFFWLSII